MTTYAENQFARVILIHSPDDVPRNVVVEDQAVFITSVYEWNFLVAVYEYGDEEKDPEFLGFLDEAGELTWEQYSSSTGIFFALTPRFLRERRSHVIGKRNAARRFAFYKAGGTMARIIHNGIVE